MSNNDIYNFFYDETEHSRVINYNTICADNYYDNFSVVIIGWRQCKQTCIIEHYQQFENKYEERKIKGELKSLTMKRKDFQFGFGSLTKNNIEFYSDFLDIFNTDIQLYFSVFSKLEYLIIQLLQNSSNDVKINFFHTVYSVTKLINVYRPNEVLKSMDKSPDKFLSCIQAFLKKRWKVNQQNITLKERENNAISEILMILNNLETIKEFNWKYENIFIGYKKLLDEMNITNLNLTIDKEGNGQTINSARDILVSGVGICNINEMDSKECVGLRFADMFVGFISKMMQSLHKSLNKNPNNEVNKIILDNKWFNINERQFKMYQKFYKILLVDNSYWFKSYASIYADDLIALFTLLKYFTNFPCFEDYKKITEKIHAENVNLWMCNELESRYKYWDRNV